MVDLMAMVGLAGSLKSAGDIAKAMVGVRDASVMQANVIELQGVILSAQSGALAAQMDQAAMFQSVKNLEAKVADLEAWDRQKQRYQLTDFGSRTFAYVLKTEARDGEPDHYACPKCFEQRARSVLHFMNLSYLKQEVYQCHVCKTEISLGSPQEPSRHYGGDGGDGWR